MTYGIGPNVFVAGSVASSILQANGYCIESESDRCSIDQAAVADQIDCRWCSHVGQLQCTAVVGSLVDDDDGVALDRKACAGCLVGVYPSGCTKCVHGDCTPRSAVVRAVILDIEEHRPHP